MNKLQYHEDHVEQHEQPTTFYLINIHKFSEKVRGKACWKFERRYDQRITEL